MRRCDQCRFTELPAVVLDNEPHGVHRQRRPERDDCVELVGAGLPFGLCGEILEQFHIGGGVGKHRRAVAQHIEALGHHIPRVLRNDAKVHRTGVEEIPCRCRLRPLADIARRHVGLSRVNLHPPAHRLFRRRQNSPLDVLEPACNHNLQGSFPAELCLDGLLRGSPPVSAALSPADTVRSNIRRVAFLHDRRELAVEASVLDAVRLRHGALRRLLFEIGAR